TRARGRWSPSRLAATFRERGGRARRADPPVGPGSAFPRFRVKPMPRWHRVFGASGVAPAPEAILEHLGRLGVPAAGEFLAGEEGWLRGDLTWDGALLSLERFEAGEEGIRQELNSWAAYLETCEHSPHHGPLMEKVIQSRQLITLSGPEEYEDLLGKLSSFL